MADINVKLDEQEIKATVTNGAKGNTGATGATGAGYTATSTTSLTIGTGSKSFTTQSGLAYTVGARVRATSAANTANWMEGLVTSYSSTTLVISMDLTNGSGTLADWNINLAGERGATGATGATGENGDMVGPGSSTDGAIALFDGATGSTLKQATTTGVLKATSGVLAAAVSGTDYAPATSGSAILKGNGSGGFSNASGGVDYEVPLTFSTGLTRNTNTITVNTSQNIGTLSNLTSNGYVKTSGGTGALSIQTVPIPETDGGTGQTTYSQGDIIYSSAANTLSKLAKSTSSTRYLSNTGTSNNPAWAQVDLTNGVTGLLPVANVNQDIMVYGVAEQGFINGGCRVQERGPFTKTLSSTYQFALVDRFAVKATGTAVSAGTISGSNASPWKVTATGVTLTGTGIMYVRYRMESRDALAYANQTASISLKVAHNVGSNINYTIYVNKANAADDFSSTTAVSNSGSISVATVANPATTTSDTLISYTSITMGDVSNGVEIEVQAACGAITTKDFAWSEFQMNIGSTVDTFRTRPYGIESVLCQRYCKSLVLSRVNLLNDLYICERITTKIVAVTFPLTVSMLGTPTLSTNFSSFVTTTPNTGGQYAFFDWSANAFLNNNSGTVTITLHRISDQFAVVRFTNSVDFSNGSVNNLVSMELIADGMFLTSEP